MTVEVAMKPEPLMVSVWPAAPAVADGGERLVTAGSGLLAVTVKLTLLEVPPPGAGLVTTTA